MFVRWRDRCVPWEWIYATGHDHQKESGLTNWSNCPNKNLNFYSLLRLTREIRHKMLDEDSKIMGKPQEDREEKHFKEGTQSFVYKSTWFYVYISVLTSTYSRLFSRITCEKDSSKSTPCSVEITSSLNLHQPMIWALCPGKSGVFVE